MKEHSISMWLLRFVRQQPLYLMIASGAAGIIWAITGHAPSPTVTLIYSFLLGNFTVLVLDNTRISCSWRKASWSRLIYLIVLLVTTPIGVTVATLVVFIFVPPALVPPAQRASFGDFLLTTWKFPTVASVIFGVGYLLYKANRDCLEDRNRQLQQTIELETVERELDAAELKQAREIQQGLLPKELPPLTEFEIAGAWEPARLVGGDYYDVIKLGEEKVAICIADVVGKGISAALLMANVQASVRAFATETASPSFVCNRINSVLCANIASGKFVTLFYGVLDASNRILQYTNAGHLRPILIGSDGSVRHLENGGALLGVFPDWKYENSTVALSPGDILMLFTDGITEAMNPDGEEFGEERLIQAARNPGQQSMEDLQTQLLGSVKAFCNCLMRDDATLILIAASLVGGAQRKAAQINYQNKATRQPTELAGVRT
jgi:sigma-B regulation protein RsbU (phosphoserine phosphatase)